MPDDLPAAAAGLFGYLGYDMIRLVEHLPNVNPDPLGVPDAVLMRPSVVAVLDGVKGRITSYNVCYTKLLRNRIGIIDLAGFGLGKPLLRNGKRIIACENPASVTHVAS